VLYEARRVRQRDGMETRKGVVEMDGEAMGGRFLCEAKSGDMPKAWRPCQKRVPPKPEADFPASEAGGMAR
jgi:hypothetical protein